MMGLFYGSCDQDEKPTMMGPFSSYNGRIKTQGGESCYDKLILILSPMQLGHHPLLQTYTPTQAIKYLPLEVEEGEGPKENPTSHVKGGGKNGEENLPK